MQKSCTLALLRSLLGVRQGAPSLVVLAETGERLLWARWLLWAARLWNRLLGTAIWRQALLASAALAAASGSLGPSSWQQA